MKKERKHLYRLMSLLIALGLIIPFTSSFAETYYVRAHDETKFNGDGTSWKWATQSGGVGAWNGPEGAASMDWTNTLGGGDVVYFIGTFIRERKGYTGVFDIDFPSGTENNYIEFRGDHSEDAGILTNFIKDSASDGLHPSKWGYIYELNFNQGSTEPLMGQTITSGTASGFVTYVNVNSGDWATNDATGTIYIWKKTNTFSNNSEIQIDAATIAYVDGGDAIQTSTYFNYGFKIFSSTGLFEYFNSKEDYSELTKQSDVPSTINADSGTYFSMVNGSYQGYWINPYSSANLINNNIRFSGFPGYRLRMDRDGDYIRFSNMSFFGDAPARNAYNIGGSSEYVTFENNYFWRTHAFQWPEGIFNYWTWTGNVHDGDGYVYYGHIYNTCSNPAASIINNWLIESNYFSGVHGGNDAHALGFQGNANDITIRYNTITDTGSGIVLWKGSCGTQNNYEITHNYIYGLNGDYEAQGRSKCHGIVMQSGYSESRDEIVIAHNVLKDPINCDFETDDYHGLGIRTISKSGHQVKVYNNTVIGYPVSFEFEGDSRDNDVDFRNNISLNPDFYHVHTNGYSSDAVEDYNLYYSPSDNKMWYYSKKDLTVSQYDSEVQLNSGITVNSNTLTADPGLDSFGRPGEYSDPILDAGANVGYKYLLSSFVWPDTTVGSAIPKLSDDSFLDIGAFMRERIPPSPPNSLTVLQ
jgi:hypothetical protein